MSTYSYDAAKFLEIVHEVKDQETIRRDCPKCGGCNTFTATGDKYTVMYNCYRASCDFKGRYAVGRALPKGKSSLDKAESEAPFPQKKWLKQDDELVQLLPRGFQESRTYKSYIKISTDWYIYIIWYNLLFERSGYERKLPKNDIRREEYGKVVRYLRKGDPGLFVPVRSAMEILQFTREPDIILVEDALSAIIVSEVCQEQKLGILPIAIGGSNLSKNQALTLIQHGYRTLYFMLDQDATGTAVQECGKYRSLFNTGVIPMSSDPKDLTKSEIHDIILYYYII